MKTLLNSAIFVLLILIVVTPSSVAQTYGQIFTKQEADANYGPVIQFVSISKTSLQNFLTQTNNYIMFNIINNTVIILDNQRRPIFPNTFQVNSSDKFIVYSCSVVTELLSLSNENIVHIEQRSEVLSVSTGGFTMEVGTMCPPICP